MTLHVAVDFGTSSTCVAVSVDGREPQVVVIDGQPLMPSAVFAAVDGTLFVGQEAERQAAIDPSRYEPHPKRRVDEGELLLGNTVISVLDVVRAVLSRAVTEARRLADNAGIDLLVLTHPADWGAIRTRVLRQAGHGLANEISLVPEPVAAAVFHAASHALADGAALAVLDLGGGTVDVSVVRRQAVGNQTAGNQAAANAEPDRGVAVGGFRVLATHGDPNFGGADIDQLLLEHVGSRVAEADREQWRNLMEGRELADRRRRRVFRQDVRGAKETLSRHTYTDVPMPPPLPDAHVTRDDLEKLIAGPLNRAAALTMETITDAGLRPDQLAAVFLVGGSSRIPLVARLVYNRTGLMPTSLDQPETVVARGALRAVTLDPLRTGGLPERPTVALPNSGPRAAPGRPARPPATPSRAAPALPQSALPQPALPQSALQPPAPQPGPPPGPQPAPQQLAPQQLAPQQPPGQPLSVQQAPTRPVAQSPQPNYVRRQSVAPVPPQPRPAPARPGRHRRTLLLSGVVVAFAAIVTVVIILATRGAPTTGATPPGEQLIAQYDYRFNTPVGWSESASNASSLEVQITPNSAPTGGDAIYVREFRLSYDSTADRTRAVQELQPQVTDAGYLHFAAEKNFANRTVAYYQQPGNDATVDWYVLFQGRVQVSIGCQYPSADQATVQDACQQVVGALTING